MYLIEHEVDFDVEEADLQLLLQEVSEVTNMLLVMSQICNRNASECHRTFELVVLLQLHHLASLLVREWLATILELDEFSVLCLDSPGHEIPDEMKHP